MEGSDSATCSYPINCTMSREEKWQFDFVATVRLITATLSILGALSIIFSAIYRKTVCNPKVHPIFVLSLVDTALSVMWIGGAWVWLRGGAKHHTQLRVGCFSFTLLTVVLQCVAMNVTLIYSLLAYSSIRLRDFSGVYMMHQGHVNIHVWHPLCSFTAYFIAWVLPVVFIAVPFAVLTVLYKLVQDADSCSCWCLPFYGNVLPRPPIGYHNDTAREWYLHHLHYFTASYSSVLIANFLTVLCCMAVVYCKIFYRIRRMILMQERNENRPLFGATRGMILAGQNDAKKRVFLFFFIYVVTSTTTFVFGVWSIAVVLEYARVKHQKHMGGLFALLLLEALFVPSQGFLNALAYGWTRGDFLSVMSSRTLHDLSQTRSSSTSSR